MATLEIIHGAEIDGHRFVEGERVRVDARMAKLLTGMKLARAIQFDRREGALRREIEERTRGQVPGELCYTPPTMAVTK